MVFEGLVGYAIALLVAVVFLQYAKLKKGAEKQLAWIASGAVLYLVALAFSFWPSTIGFVLPQILPAIVQLLGFIAVFVGGLWLAYKMLLE